MTLPGCPHGWGIMNSPHLCAPSPSASGLDPEHPCCPVPFSSFIPSLCHLLQEAGTDYRPAWATTFQLSSSWVGTQAVVTASTLADEMLGKLSWVAGGGVQA